MDWGGGWPSRGLLKSVPFTPGTERSNPEQQPSGLSEYPRDPEHRSYSDRGEPGAEERARADGHTGRRERGWDHSLLAASKG